MPQYDVDYISRRCANPPPGKPKRWGEFRVMDGRRVISRHETHDEADRALQELQAASRNLDRYVSRERVADNARALLMKLDSMTGAEFKRGAGRAEYDVLHEMLRAALAKLDAA